MILLLSTAANIAGQTDERGIYEPWDVVLGIIGGVFYSLNPTFGLTTEIILFGHPLGNTLRVDYGVAARGVYSFYDSGLGWGWSALSGGSTASIHLSFPRESQTNGPLGSSEAEWMALTDINLLLGVDVEYYLPFGDWERYNLSFESLRVGIVAVLGLNLFLSEMFAVRVEGGLWGELSPGGSIGALLRL